jgi:predicted aspartyl protease
MKIEISVDSNDQWFATLAVVVAGKRVNVDFKIDTGCNALVLSRRTLQRLGIEADTQALSQLATTTGRLASGEKSEFKAIGNVSLIGADSRAMHICTAPAICHATRETNDLLGTKVLRQFKHVNFCLREEKYMELLI